MSHDIDKCMIKIIEHIMSIDEKIVSIPRMISRLENDDVTDKFASKLKSSKYTENKEWTRREKWYKIMMKE